MVGVIYGFRSVVMVLFAWTAEFGAWCSKSANPPRLGWSCSVSSTESSPLSWRFLTGHGDSIGKILPRLWKHVQTPYTIDLCTGNLCKKRHLSTSIRRLLCTFILGLCLSMTPQRYICSMHADPSGPCTRQRNAPLQACRHSTYCMVAFLSQHLCLAG